MIPKLIHFVWIGGDLPKWAERNVAAFCAMNPDHFVVVHDETSLAPELQDAYDRAEYTPSKADLIRYSVLYEHGGWYFDVDIVPFRPLSDAEHGWNMRGRRVLVSKQRGHKSGERMPYANGILACSKHSAGMAAIIDVAKRTRWHGNCSYGPAIVKDLVHSMPTMFLVVEAGWWFPISIDETRRAYPLIREQMYGRLALMTERTGGQMPMGAHLWAGAVDLDELEDADVDLRPVAVVDVPPPLTSPIHEIREGMLAAGYNVIGRREYNAGNFVFSPTVIICWNGLIDPKWTREGEKHGCPVLYVEHGFWDRGECAQVDHAGFLHRASWVGRVAREDPPAGSYERLRRWCPGVRPMRRRKGYILVLGQLSNDTQLIDSEIKGNAQLLTYLSRAKPADYEMVFRPHPLMTDRRWDNLRHEDNITYRPRSKSDVPEYRKYKTASPSLKEDLEGAAFCVAINSNALVEATAMGIPCMAFGPSIGIYAAVYRQATVDTLKEDMRAMCAGWAPAQTRVWQYLAWLAGRQWHRDELKNPATLLPLLRQAGVQHGG